jgi:HAMP domain-containing protein
VEKESSRLVWDIVAVVVAAALVILTIFGIARWRRYRRKIGPLERGKHYEDTLNLKHS